MKKSHIIATIALVLVLALLAGIYLVTRPAVVEGEKQITITVVHGDGSSRDFPLTTTEEYVGRAIVSAGLAEDHQGPYGLYLEELDGERAVWEENGAYWAFYVGEEYATTGLDETPVTDGAVYKLVFTLG